MVFAARLKCGILYLMALCLSGCAMGINSEKSILDSNDSDEIVDVSGYWGLYSAQLDNTKSSEPIVKGGNPLPFYVEDVYSGEVPSKDFVYNIKDLDGKNKDGSQGNIFLRGKSYEDGYVLQWCKKLKDSEENEGCLYTYGTRGSDGSFYIFFTLDSVVPENAKVLMGEEYSNSKDKNDIKVSNDFVDLHGKELLEMIGVGVAQKVASSQAKISMAILKQLTRDEAMTFVEERRKRRAEKSGK